MNERQQLEEAVLAKPDDVAAHAALAAWLRANGEEAAAEWHELVAKCGSTYKATIWLSILHAKRAPELSLGVLTNRPEIDSNQESNSPK